MNEWNFGSCCVHGSTKLKGHNFLAWTHWTSSVISCSCFKMILFATVPTAVEPPGSAGWWGRQPCHITQTGLAVFVVITKCCLRKPFSTKQRVNPLHVSGVARRGKMPNLTLQDTQGVRASLMPSDEWDSCKQWSAWISFCLQSLNSYWDRWAQSAKDTHIFISSILSNFTPNYCLSYWDKTRTHRTQRIKLVF